MNIHFQAMELDLKQRHPDNYHMQGCRDGRMQGPPPPIRRDHPKQVDEIGLRDKRLRLIAVLPSLSLGGGGQWRTYTEIKHIPHINTWLWRGIVRYSVSAPPRPSRPRPHPPCKHLGRILCRKTALFLQLLKSEHIFFANLWEKKIFRLFFKPPTLFRIFINVLQNFIKVVKNLKSEYGRKVHKVKVFEYYDGGDMKKFTYELGTEY